MPGYGGRTGFNAVGALVQSFIIKLVIDQIHLLFNYAYSKLEEKD